MKPLTLELTKGTKQRFQSIGWKTPEPGQPRRHFYALDETGKSVVLSLKPVIPAQYVPGCAAVFAGEPFPEAVCVEILPCRLLPPPCYRSRADFESQLPLHFVLDPWRAVYWNTHRQYLIPERSDILPLKDRLAKWLAVMRRAYERDRSALRKRINRLQKVPLARLNLKTELERADLVKKAKEQLAIVESETPVDGVACKGRLKLTLEEVKQGREGIRDAWMHENWAKNHGENLREMAQERRHFRIWLETHTGTLANIFDSTARERRKEIAPPDFGENHDGKPPFLEACAKVRYRARFANNPGTVVFLADCELRPELSVQELDEVAKLRVAAKATALRFSINYRQVFWFEAGVEIEAKLSPIQATAISALDQAPGRVLAREEWRQAIYSDSPPTTFRPDKLFAYNEGRKVWDRFIRSDGGRYRLTLAKD